MLQVRRRECNRWCGLCRYPDLNEGDLTETVTTMIKARALVQYAEGLHLGQFVADGLNYARADHRTRQ